MLSDAESICQDQLKVTWNSLDNQLLSVCLYQKQADKPIQCWHNTSIGISDFPAVINANTEFELRSQESNQLLAQAVFQVIYEHKKSQRSRRNPWSFF